MYSSKNLEINTRIVNMFFSALKYLFLGAGADRNV